MRHALPTTLRRALGVALAAALVACGGSPQEELVDEQADVMAEFADVVEGIGDADDLEDARPRMRELGTEMKALADRWEAIAKDGLTEADAEELAKDHKELAAASARLSAAFMNLATNPELAPHLPELMKEFGDAFEPSR